MIFERDNLYNFVCELLTRTLNDYNIVGTGMFVVSVDENNISKLRIVTASHVAKTTTLLTNIILANNDGKSMEIPLSQLGDIKYPKHHSEADISVFPIITTNDVLKLLQGRFFPYNHFNLEKRCVSRDVELTSIGFPKGIGTQDYFSPLSYRTFASSAFITYPRADESIFQTFFFSENPSTGGYSGRPVFNLGYVYIDVMCITKAQTICYGFVHGNISDKTGGKITMVTPAFYLKDLID